MSRRLWITAITLLIAIVAIVVLSFLALLENIPALSVVVLVFVALAVVAFNYLVVNPMLLENAKKSARSYCEAGQILDPKLHDRLCGRLSNAPEDPEAAELHKKLTELKEKSDNKAGAK
jgi:hypothetical protein